MSNHLARRQGFICQYLPDSSQPASFKSFLLVLPPRSQRSAHNLTLKTILPTVYRQQNLWRRKGISWNTDAWLGPQQGVRRLCEDFLEISQLEHELTFELDRVDQVAVKFSTLFTVHEVVLVAN